MARKNKKKKDEGSLLHVRLNFREALRSKKDFLISEMNFLQLVKIIRTYKEIRAKELNAKIKMKNKIKELRTELSNMQKIMPKLGALEEFRTEREHEKELQLSRATKTLDIDSELQDIQEKLRAIQSP